MAEQVAILDYGVGNLLSVSRALEECGAEPVLVANARGLSDAPRAVLPGVGAFGSAMGELRARGLVDAVRDYAATGRPLLGICLGMQLLLDASEEFGRHEGIGLVAGTVIPVPATGTDGSAHKIPHIGWSPLVDPATGSRHAILDGLDGAWMYFVHSFMAVPDDPAYRAADCEYGGVPVPAVVGAGSVYGCQFHPEKSGPSGLAFLRNFLAL